MNRRNFLSTLAQAAAAFTILPGAVTYERKWKKEGELWISAVDQRLFVTTFCFGVGIPEGASCWTYDDCANLRSYLIV